MFNYFLIFSSIKIGLTEKFKIVLVCTIKIRNENQKKISFKNKQNENATVDRQMMCFYSTAKSCVQMIIACNSQWMELTKLKRMN